jgi:hypothetical protein
MSKKKEPVELDEEEDEKYETPPTWKKPEPPPRFKYDDSGFPLNEKKPNEKKS